MDQYALYVGGGGRPGHEDAVARVELGALVVRFVQIADDAFRVEQHDQVLRQEAQRVHLELRFGQPYRACLRDSEHCPHDAYVDVVEFRWGAYAIERPVADDLGRRRTNDVGIREELADQGAQIAVEMANLGPDGPTGTFVDDTGTLPW